MNCVITKPTSVRNMVGIYKLSSFPWCSERVTVGDTGSG